MSSVYYRTPEMMGEKNFRCHNCGKMFIKDITGIYTMKLVCPRCKTEITVKTKERIPNANNNNI